MNKKNIKLIATSLAVLSCMSFIPKKAVAYTLFNATTDLEDSTYIAEKDKSDKDKNEKKLDIFSSQNSKYLSSEQKKQLKELKECKENGTKLTKEQMESLHSIVDSIIKGKLGNEKYKNFKCLMEKKHSGSKLTDEEEEKLKEYKNIIDGNLSSKDIFKEFLR